MVRRIGKRRAISSEDQNLSEAGGNDGESCAF
ncbi:hypothetical protein SAMN05421677_104183 [Halobacillus aidingensis]|uniref:Uncharacterized protein n=1 Tax=Halobacillus aidingensis TaxID=240303 RepID=A0A1H0ITE3_HALAD|nr:hypothetical protein SAMN05421677_104183 [Halobacillus aidingensis]